MSIPVITLLTVVLCAGILISGLLAVTLNNLLSAVISAGLASLFASVVYVVLAAPDVAMTEASIGSGLTTMIFLYAIRKTQGGEEKKKNGKDCCLHGNLPVDSRSTVKSSST